jgi:hypothetical protein
MTTRKRANEVAMAGFVIVIGGQGRNVGKTSVVCALIRAMPEARWTAIKISGHEHRGARAVTVYEEHEARLGTDSSRYLASGASRSLLVCAPEGQLAEAMPRVREEIAGAENVVLESNRVLEFLKPDLFAMVIDPKLDDFKPSAQRYLDHADTLLLTVGLPGRLDMLRRLDRIPRFRIAPPTYSSPEFVEFVRSRMQAS